MRKIKLTKTTFAVASITQQKPIPSIVNEYHQKSLMVKRSKTSNKNVIKLGVLLSFTAGDFALPSTYLIGIFYASTMFAARDDNNQKKFMLANHSLDLIWGNTECNKKKTVRLAMKMIGKK